MDKFIEQIEPYDDEALESWISITDEEDLFGVEANQYEDSEWPWQIGITVMELIREEPLESALISEITSAVQSVSGVTNACQEDREVWIVKGEPSGKEWVKVCSLVLDRWSDSIREEVETI